MNTHQPTCIYIYPITHLPTPYLPIHPPIYWPTYIHTCLNTKLSTYPTTYILSHSYTMYIYVGPTYLTPYLPTYNLPTYLYISIDISTYIYLPTYIHTCLHTHQPTYIHTAVDIYTHIYNIQTLKQLISVPISLHRVMHLECIYTVYTLAYDIQCII